MSQGLVRISRMQYRQLMEFGENQHSLVTLDQLRTFCSANQIQRLKAQHMIEPMFPRVFRVRGSSSTDLQRMHAAALSTGGAVSNQTAAYLWKLIDRCPADIDVLLPSGRQVFIPGVRIHQSHVIERLSTVDGISVTNPARSLIGIACEVPPFVLERALEQFLFLDLGTFDSLRRELDLIGERGRDGVGVLRALLDELDPHDDQCASPLERRVLRALRELGLPEPTKQYEVVVGGRRRYFDLAYPELRIGIEAHSRSYHARLSAFEDDAERNGDLTLADWNVFYVTSRKFESGVMRIAKAVRTAGSPRGIRAYG